MATISSDYVRSLPKAECTSTSKGTVTPEMALTCARRNGVQLPWTTEAQLIEAYDFDGLPAFLGVLFEVAATLRKRQDFYDLALDYLGRAHSDGIGRAEVFFGAQTFLDADVEIGTMLDAILAAFRDAGEVRALLRRGEAQGLPHHDSPGRGRSVAEGIPLTVCPLSNVALKAVPSNGGAPAQTTPRRWRASDDQLR